jgi:hypothetical protein
VLVANGSTWVTTFRSAELIELTPEGAMKTHLVPPPTSLAQVTFTPHVAWRTVTDGNRVVMVHQLHVKEEVTQLTNPGPGAPYYGKPYCTASVVSSAITVFDTKNRGVAWSKPIIGSMPIDVAMAPDRIAVAFAGAGMVNEYLATGLDEPPAGAGGCLVPVNSSAPGTPTGVALVSGTVQWFEPAGVLHGADPEKDRQLVTLRTLDPARLLFHAQSPSGVSCGSCHPEGFDDGHTWQFGPRHVRSQSLEGGLLATAPFHWDGRLKSVGAVLDETFEVRMGGAKVDSSVADDLADWLDTVPARSASYPADPAAVKKGRYVFTKAGCDSCHAGEAYTNGKTVDVGTGAAYQVPSLEALRWRGPWMHDGCAQTLADRFTPDCGGTAHGTVAPGDVDALIAFLKTL